jgi:hypothetical protein
MRPKQLCQVSLSGRVRQVAHKQAPGIPDGSLRVWFAILLVLVVAWSNPCSRPCNFTAILCDSTLPISCTISVPAWCILPIL